MISSAPEASHIDRSSSLNPACGGTTPMFAGQASVITQAISLPRAANSALTASASLYGSTTVSAADAPVTPGVSGRPSVATPRAGRDQQGVDMTVIAARELHDDRPAGVAAGQP